MELPRRTIASAYRGRPEPASDGHSCPSSGQDDRVGDALVPDALESALNEIVALRRPHERQNRYWLPDAWAEPERSSAIRGYGVVVSTVMDRKLRAKQIQDQIRSILLNDWHPLRFAEIPEAADEYDAYIGGVYRLLYSQASVEAVARHLHEIVIGPMGLSSDSAENHLEVARKLCAIDVRL